MSAEEYLDEGPPECEGVPPSATPGAVLARNREELRAAGCFAAQPPGEKVVFQRWGHVKLVLPPLLCGGRPLAVVVQTTAMRGEDSLVLLNASTWGFTSSTVSSGKLAERQVPGPDGQPMAVERLEVGADVPAEGLGASAALAAIKDDMPLKAVLGVLEAARGATHSFCQDRNNPRDRDWFVDVDENPTDWIALGRTPEGALALTSSDQVRGIHTEGGRWSAQRRFQREFAEAADILGGTMYSRLGSSQPTMAREVRQFLTGDPDRGHEYFTLSAGGDEFRPMTPDAVGKLIAAVAVVEQKRGFADGAPGSPIPPDVYTATSALFEAATRATPWAAEQVEGISRLAVAVLSGRSGRPFQAAYGALAVSPKRLRDGGGWSYEWWGLERRTVHLVAERVGSKVVRKMDSWAGCWAHDVAAGGELNNATWKPPHPDAPATFATHAALAAMFLLGWEQGHLGPLGEQPASQVVPLEGRTAIYASQEGNLSVLCGWVAGASLVGRCPGEEGDWVPSRRIAQSIPYPRGSQRWRAAAAKKLREVEGALVSITSGGEYDSHPLAAEINDGGQK